MLKKIKKIPVLIVEDNLTARNHLKTLLKEYDDIQIVAGVDNTEDAWSLINTGAVQGVFLDINILGETDRAGLDLAARFQQLPKDKQPWIVFVTGYREHALEAHGFNTVHYLLKPLDSNKIKEALSKVREQRLVVNQRITIDFATEQGHGVKYCDLADILYIETFFSGNGRVKIKLRDGSFLQASHVVLKNWLTDYGAHFLQIHSSRLVNKQHVSGFINKDGKCHVTVNYCDDTLRVGDSYLADFLALFQK